MAKRAVHLLDHACDCVKADLTQLICFYLTLRDFCKSLQVALPRAKHARNCPVFRHRSGDLKDLWQRSRRLPRRRSTHTSDSLLIDATIAVIGVDTTPASLASLQNKPISAIRHCVDTSPLKTRSAAAPVTARLAGPRAPRCQRDAVQGSG